MAVAVARQLVAARPAPTHREPRPSWSGPSDPRCPDCAPGTSHLWGKCLGILVGPVTKLPTPSVLVAERRKHLGSSRTHLGSSLGGRVMRRSLLAIVFGTL